MKTKTLYAALEAKQQKPVSLRANIPATGDTLKVDREAGIIFGASAMTMGPALGWDFNLDETSLKQLAAIINSVSGGVICRFKHPKENDKGGYEDKLGEDVGYAQNARVDGNQVRVDIHLGEWAKALPGFGDVWTYLLTKAEKDPKGFGLSAVILGDYEPVGAGKDVTALVARIKQCEAIDFVGRPAANPNGLLSVREAVQEPPKVPSWQEKFTATLSAVKDLRPTAKQICRAMNAAIKK